MVIKLIHSCIKQYNTVQKEINEMDKFNIDGKIDPIDKLRHTRALSFPWLIMYAVSKQLFITLFKISCILENLCMQKQLFH